MNMKRNFDNLNLDSTLSELHLYNFTISYLSKLSIVFNVFKDNPDLPGIIILNKEEFIGIISKIHFFEVMSGQFSFDIYKNKTVESFYEDYPIGNILILPSYTTISTAAEKALLREQKFLFDPIVVQFENNKYFLLDIEQLLLAQTHIQNLALQSLKEANEFKDEILSIAAHDLKNYLNSILGFSSILKEDLMHIDYLYQSISLIHTAANSMLDLILELLESAAVESLKLELHKSEIDLLELTHSIIEEYNQSAKKKNQLIKFSFDENKSYKFFGDKIKLKESFTNLISNAIKYSPLGKNIFISLVKKDGYIFFNVKDEGIGLSNEDLKKIFGKFQRLTPKPTAGETSTGLGLYIVKQLVELHNGEIIVNSELGKGSEFIIKLPTNHQ